MEENGDCRLKHPLDTHEFFFFLFEEYTFPYIYRYRYITYISRSYEAWNRSPKKEEEEEEEKIRRKRKKIYSMLYIKLFLTLQFRNTRGTNKNSKKFIFNWKLNTSTTCVHCTNESAMSVKHIIWLSFNCRWKGS